MCLFVYSASNVHCTPIICQNTKPMKANNQYQYLKINSNRDMVSATSTSTCKLKVIVSKYTFGEDCCCSAVFLVFRIWYLVCQGNQSMWGVDSCCCNSGKYFYYVNGFELQVSLENSTGLWFSVFHIYCLYFSLHAISQKQLLIKLQIAET